MCVYLCGVIVRDYCMDNLFIQGSYRQYTMARWWQYWIVQVHSEDWYCWQKYKMYINNNINNSVIISKTHKRGTTQQQQNKQTL